MSELVLKYHPNAQIIADDMNGNVTWLSEAILNITFPETNLSVTDVHSIEDVEKESSNEHWYRCIDPFVHCQKFN